LPETRSVESELLRRTLLGCVVRRSDSAGGTPPIASATAGAIRRAARGSAAGLRSGREGRPARPAHARSDRLGGDDAALREKPRAACGRRARSVDISHRLRAEILLDTDSNAAPEAEALFGQSLEIARRQEAKTFELRAATSLARLWQREGRRDAARALLAPVYAWFTEGFETRDPREAKALLEDLAG
jgi:hypothetical protein